MTDDRTALGDAGRVTVHTPEEQAAYAAMDDAEKQAFLRREYEARNPLDPYATSRDWNARELEIEAIARHFPASPGRVLDLGCGNGYTLLSLAQRLGGGWDLCGVDFTPSLVEGAEALTAERAATLASVPRFVCADAIAHVEALADGSVDAVITERFLQNLPTREAQYRMIGEIARILRPGGRFLMCEGSQRGHRRLNELREACGLDPIPETSPENVSSLRFDDDDVERHAGDVGFNVTAVVAFPAYFAISRVLHPMLVAPDPPRFDAPINEAARRLQLALEHHPVIGSNVLWVLDRSA
jgi:SAM-dependent methyltransferase